MWGLILFGSQSAVGRKPCFQNVVKHSYFSLLYHFLLCAFAVSSDCLYWFEMPNKLKSKIHKILANRLGGPATSSCCRPSSWVAGILYTFTHISNAALAPLIIHSSAQPRIALIQKWVYRHTYTCKHVRTTTDTERVAPPPPTHSL